MTKRNLIELKLALEKLENNGSTKFKYLILKNNKILNSAITPLIKIEEDIKKHITPFENDRNELILELGTKKDNGTVFIDTENAEIFEKFTARLGKLTTKHAEGIAEYNTKWKDYQELLNEEIDDELVFTLIDIELFPDNDVSKIELDILYKFNIIE